jgi:hypothetical protein
MLRVDSRLLMGATLFGAPKVTGGIQISGLASVLIVVVVVSVGLMLYRGSRRGPSDSDPGGGWGDGPPPPDSPRPDHPRGGIPLDDAAPARIRLRGEARLADLLPTRARRPAREPERAPARTPRPSAARSSARAARGALALRGRLRPPHG